MPRLFREAPLIGIWEGSGNVSALDTLRAMATRPECVGVLFDESPRRRTRPAAGRPHRRARVESLAVRDARVPARKVTEDIGLALQGSLLVRHGHPAVPEAFLATGWGRWGGAYGALPTGWISPDPRAGPGQGMAPSPASTPTP